MLTTQQLTDLGYEVRPDSDQPGLFLWIKDEDGSDISFDSEVLATADASRHALSVHQLSVCDNCSKVHSEETLEEIDRIEERVSPGEKMPSGQCPDCGCLCHLYSPDTTVPNVDDFQVALAAIEGYLANKADKGDDVANALHAMLKPWLEVRQAAMSLNDNGVNFEMFVSEEARIRHFAKQDNAIDDHYFIDIRGVIVDVGLANVGNDALDDL